MVTLVLSLLLFFYFFTSCVSPLTLSHLFSLVLFVFLAISHNILISVSFRAQSWRVFETAKAAKKAAAKAALSSSSTSRMSISASGDVTGPSSICDSSRLSVCTSDVESQASDGYSGDLDSLYE